MLRESHRLEIEPATCKSQVQLPTAEPPREPIWMKSETVPGMSQMLEADPGIFWARSAQ